MLDENPQTKFVLVRFDIDKFKLINSYFGKDTGDKVLIKIAKMLKMYAKNSNLPMTYGRMDADIFCVCATFNNNETVIEEVEKARGLFSSFFQNFEIVVSFGIYVINDPSVEIAAMYDNTILAVKTCKGNYIKSYAFYNDEMSAQIVKEQNIVNDMNAALEEKQFVVYYQPKYDLRTNKPYGAEALVRWIHPEKGMIYPGEFIPIFERNGFICKLDYFVWETVCKQIKNWIDNGENPAPISVNVSRVNLYNPRITDILMNLVIKYNIPPELLNIELTETAYAEMPAEIEKTMSKLQRYGFKILMDDFGSGYSSLNILKDIEVDILKVDMKFLPCGNNSGRAEKILASVVKMAKWLDLPVIIEGVETESQTNFLQSIGCDYIQGYYFAKPMPLSNYENLIKSTEQAVENKSKCKNSREMIDELWNSNSNINEFFTSFVQPVAIYEYDGENIDLLRVNPEFNNIIGYNEASYQKDDTLHKYIDDKGITSLKKAFEAATESENYGECEYMRFCKEGELKWMHIKVQYLSRMGDKHIMLAVLNDITEQKRLEIELKKYNEFANPNLVNKSYMLVVDDIEINRSIVKSIFEDKYRVLEASDGKEALELLLRYKKKIDIVILDLIMPKMDGKTFLEIKNADSSTAGIPVIVVSSDGSEAMQLNMIAMGVNDYVTKPFVPKVVERRVKNVIEFNERFREMIKGLHKKELVGK